MDTKRVGQEVLARAVMQLGGTRAAALRLEVTESLLLRLLEGSMPVPDNLLLKAMDFALDATPPEPPPAVRPLKGPAAS